MSVTHGHDTSRPASSCVQTHEGYIQLHTIDMLQMTTHMKMMGHNNALSLKQLSLRLVTLMALVEASRTSEIAALDLRYRVYSPEGVTFRLPTLTKKRTTGAPPRQLFFGGFPPDERLCVSKCLKQYEEGFRDKTPGAPGRVFLSYVTPHRPVKSQQVAHWIEAMLESAGINTAVYSAQQCTQHTRRGCICHSGREARSVYHRHTQNSGLEQGVHI